MVRPCCMFCSPSLSLLPAFRPIVLRGMLKRKHATTEHRVIIHVQAFTQQRKLDVTVNWKEQWTMQRVGYIADGCISVIVWIMWRKVGFLWSLNCDDRKVMTLTTPRSEARPTAATTTKTITRKLSYRKDDRAMRPIYGSPENFRESLNTPTRLLFPKFLMGFNVPIDPMNVRTKLEVRSFPDLNISDSVKRCRCRQR